MRTWLAAGLLAGTGALAVGVFTEPAPPEPTAEPSAAALVWRSGSYQVRLTDAPCQFAGWRAELEEEGIPPARAYVATQPGRPTVAGCWARDIAGDFILRDATTPPEQMPAPAGWFTREVGI